MTSDKKKMSPKIKRILNYSLSIILTVVFLYIAVHGVDITEVINEISKASIFWILIFLLVFMVSHYLRAVRWKVILNSVKPDTSMKNLFGALMVGYGVNCVVPRLGEVSRAVLLGKWEGLSKSSMFGAVILERLIDVLFLGFSVFVSILIWSDDLQTQFPWLKTSLVITAVFMAGGLAFLYFLVKYKDRFKKIIGRFLSKFSEKLSEKIVHALDMLIQGMSCLKGTKNYLLTIILSFAIISTYAFVSYIGFFTLGMEEILPVNFAMGWIIMSISGIGVVIPTPGGTGSYHTLVKSALLLFGFNEVISLSYAFLTHALSYIIFICTGLISFFLLNKQHESLLKVVSSETE